VGGEGRIPCRGKGRRMGKVMDTNAVIQVTCPKCGGIRLTTMGYLGKAKCPVCHGVLIRDSGVKPAPERGDDGYCDRCRPAPAKIIPCHTDWKGDVWRCAACEREINAAKGIVPPQPEDGPTDDEIDAFMIEQARRALKRVSERRYREKQAQAQAAETARLEGKTR
jgi:hypothetical protein